jgi:hypothetical protein
MTFDSITSTLFEMWLAGLADNNLQTVCLLGAPGIGKTSAARELAVQMTEHRRKSDPNAKQAVSRVLDLSSMLPEDLGGLPYAKDRGDGRVTKYAPPEWLAEICEPDAYGVLVFDDLPAASTAIQVASRQASLERRVHDHRIAPGVMIVVTGNRREDKSAASTLPAHFRNSVMILTVEPDFKRWETWYHDQGYDSLVTQFLTYRSAHFSHLPADADSVGAFATPRTWSMLGRLIPTGRKTGTLRDMAAGLVGEGVTTELMAFELVRSQLVAPEKVLADPEGALPNAKATLNSPDRMIAMVTGLADAAIHKAAQKTGGKAYEEYLKALAYVTDAGGREYVATSITTFIAHRGNFRKLKDAVNNVKGEPRVKGMLTALAACFKE